MPYCAENDFQRIQRGNFVLKNGDVDERTRAEMRYIPNDNPIEHLEGVLDLVKAGKMTLMHVYENGERVGFTVFEINNEPMGKELMSLVSYGKNEAGNLAESIIPMLEEIARKNDCKTIRLNTARPGLCKKLQKMDWFVSEILMRKELK